MTAKTKTEIQRLIRTATCDWDVNGEKPGDVETIQLQFFFYAPTIKELKDTAADIDARAKENPNEVVWASEHLLKRLHSIPHLQVGVGQPTVIDIDFLEQQDLGNLRSMRDAIDGELAPKQPQPK